ncbi:MAG TPA: DUF3313 family protein [Alphaproteobacteria bacterium]|nr:DUF3313 family protein [Alphaproteobacteria bacterium]
MARWLALLLLLPLAGCAGTGSSGPSAAPVEWDGLQRVQVKGLDLVYRKPGVSLAGYSKIMVDPLQISFSKDRDANGGWRTGAFPIGESDRERIRTALAGIVQDELVRQVQDRGGYRIVTSPGPDVLRVSAAIIDINVTAPDMTPGRSVVITASKGSMTLVAELRDSETGTLLARAIDHSVDDSSFRWQVANSVTNADAARRAAAGWANILRERLDAARGAESSG